MTGITVLRAFYVVNRHRHDITAGSKPKPSCYQNCIIGVSEAEPVGEMDPIVPNGAVCNFYMFVGMTKGLRQQYL
jgi:hypothetical protein